MLVTIEAGDSATRTVTQAQVLAGDVNASYPTRSRTGGSTISVETRGIAVRTLLQNDLGIPVAAVSSVDISVRGLTSTLTPADLGEPTDAGFPYPDGLLPAVFTSSEALGYIEPLRNDTDTNPNFQGLSNSPISLAVHVAAQLNTPIIATPSTSVPIATDLPFTASVPAGAPGVTYSYVWDFGDGPDVPGTRDTISHRYTAAGTYPARVIASGSDGSVGVSSAVTMTATSPVVSPSPSPSAAGSAGGGSGEKGPTTGPVTSSGSRGGAAPSTTDTKSQAKNGTAADGAASGTSTGPAQKSPAPKSTVQKGTKKTATPTSPRETETPVTGYVILAAGTTPTTTAPEAARASAPSARAATVEADHRRQLLALAGGAGLAFLLALGIVREVRSSRARPRKDPR
ncbi:PKD domain-containing protein [Frondihabitans sp. PhB188]|uniref:PKD domain-containing protein n=1 Tax=Frondihabitans sp. PhB188 TaxID=2485200 RepID=UPI0011CDE7FD|nr:PKD domain-containing protein [Frondihabitans sp. PhB188]